MKKTLKIAGILIGSTVLLGACSGAQAPDPNPTPHDTIGGPGLFSGKSGKNILDGFGTKSTFGGGGEASTLGVNAYMWRAALETVSMLPLQSADSTGGVIITDWKVSPANANERVKATVYLFGKALAAQSVQVKLYKQMQQNGDWKDVDVSANTIRQLEDAILTKARALHIAAEQAGK